MNNLAQVISCTFNDFDALTEAVNGWNLEIHKLDSGSFTGELFQLLSSDLILSHVHFSNRLRQVGEPPRGYRTFAILSSEEAQIFWRGKQVGGNDLLLFPNKGELHASTEAGFNIFTISIKEHLLHSAAEQYYFQGLEKRLRSNEVFRCSAQLRKQLLKMLRAICIEHRADPTLDPTDAALKISMQLIQMLAFSGHSSARQPSPLRREVIQAVDQHLFQYSEEPPSIPELCEVTGVSKRTLEYAFNEFYGMNPKAYLNAVRLNAVRKQLWKAKPGNLKVSDAANAWGFWHMGKFAADYRKLFGEVPSETLKAIALS